MKIQNILSFNTNSLTYKAGFLAFGNGLRGISGILLLIILSRTLSPFEYGGYRQIWMLITILSQIFLLGLPVSLNFFISGNTVENQGKYLGQTLSLTFVISFVLSIIVLLFRNKIGIYFNNPSLTTYIVYVTPVFLLFSTFQLFTPALVAKGYYRNSVYVNTVISILLLLFVGGTSIIQTNIKFIYFGLDIAVVLGFFFIIITLFNKYNTINFEVNFKLIRKQLKYAVPLGLASLIGLISKYLDKFIVGRYYSPEEFAMYANGAFELPFIGLVTGSAMAILLPEFVRFYKKEDYSSIGRVWRNSIRKISIILIPVTIFSLFFSEEIIVAMFSKKYVASTQIFFIYLLVLPMRITTFGSVLSAIDQNKVIMRWSIIGLVMNVIISLILVEYIGIIGPTIATVVSIYFVGFGQLNQISRLIKTKISNILPINDLAIITISSLLFIIIIRYFLQDFHSLYFRLILSGVIFTIVYYGFFKTIYPKINY
tara:strand:- start:3316 stop:4767 length:1452 start_codon:yes stop_codon:yes gene_type:complete